VQREELKQAARASFEHVQMVERSETELSKPRAEKATNAPEPVHLLTDTATMAQACGSTRLVLRGHTGPVAKVRLALAWC
jgi:hypothetical protein